MKRSPVAETASWYGQERPESDTQQLTSAATKLRRSEAVTEGANLETAQSTHTDGSPF